MRYVMVVVPLLFLVALVALAAGLYRGTQANTACQGDDCARLTDQDLADRAIEARQR